MSDILFILCPPHWARLPHLGLSALAGALRRQGLTCALADINALVYSRQPKAVRAAWTVDARYTTREWAESMLTLHQDLYQSLAAQAARARYLGFSVTRANRAMIELLVERLKGDGLRKPVVYGGPEITLCQHASLSMPAGGDFYLSGAAENGLPELLKGGAQSPQPFSLTECSRDDSVFDMALYPGARLARFAEYGRGCVNRCSFCSERLLYETYSRRSLPGLLQEITTLASQGVRHIVFADSMLNAHRRGFEELVAGLAGLETPITWEAQIAVDETLSPQLAAYMKDSGCVNLFIGLESGSDRVLRLMNKPHTAASATEFFQTLHGAGLQFEISLIANYPGETQEMIQETVSFIRKNAGFIPKIAQISRFQPYPGIEAVIPEGYSSDLGESRVTQLLAACRDAGIPYTPAYIDNLYL